MDPLSDILSLVDARSVTSGRLYASAPWAVRFPPPERIKFTALLSGSCWLIMDGLPDPVRLSSGDVIVVNGQRSFSLASGPSVVPIDTSELFREGPERIARIGAGEDVFLFGGHVAIDLARGGLLLDVLPPLFHVSAVMPEAGALSWLLEHLVSELSTKRPGATLAASHLAQLLFVQVLRAYLAGPQQPKNAGWLRALADERIAPALKLLHGDPSRSWTLGELAKASAMSRTTFALRFKTATGTAPLDYLRRWRMRLAERALLTTGSTVASVALSLGYGSESAFSHAFKRVVGVSPTQYRITLGDLPA